MGEIVNLRQVRKARQRAAEAAAAAVNRVQHGRSKAEKAVAEVESGRADRQLDGARLERDGEAGE